MGLTKWGFDEWFQQRMEPDKLPHCRLARVITVDRESYIIRNELGVIRAELTGKLMYGADSPLDFPVVGDWVYAHYVDDDSFAIIHEIFPRKTIINRKTSGKKVEVQVIASNLDTALIMQSLDANYNLRRLERYVAMVREGRIRPVVILSKRDLVTPHEVEEKRAAIAALMPALRVLVISNLDLSGVDAVQHILKAGETFCLLGSSGVGKTTLLNTLIGDETFETRSIRVKDSKGRHTTSRRQLTTLHNGAMIIDTPGMRELGNLGLETGLHETFKEISELVGTCRYKDCSHTHEDGCGVLAALQNGAISPDRYHSFLKLKREADYNERTYLEKRRKDKQFGKMCKSVMKYNKKLN